jgi:Do/DeqQ family serine protease
MKKHLILTTTVAVLASTLTFWAWQSTQPEPVTYKVESPQTASPVLYTKGAGGNFAPLDFTVVAEQVTDAVVHIKSSGRAIARQRGGSPFDDMFKNSPWGDFFEMPDAPRQQAPNGRQSMGSGSGVLISSDGYIVTNNHVIDNADDIEIVLNDNRVFDADIVGTDPTTDLALLKIDVDGLSHLTFADSDVVKTGQWVMAVGNPFDLTSTVTAGIVSATGRSINILREQYAIESFIQTDAAINPGNSGGALVNLDGQLIGINTAISSPTGSYSGYGFAVPSNLVGKVITDLREYGNVQRGVLGVMIRNVDGALADNKDLDITYGVYVDSTMVASAAADAGIQSGDIIVAVDEVETPTSPVLQERIANKRPGDQVAVTVNRQGKERDFVVTLKSRDGGTGIVKPEEKSVAGILGADFEPLSEEDRKAMGIDGGVVVKDIQRGKLSRETTMQPGFVITRVDGDKVKSVEELTKKLKKRKGGVMLEGRYKRDDKPYYYAFGM